MRAVWLLLQRAVVGATPPAWMQCAACGGLSFYVCRPDGGTLHLACVADPAHHPRFEFPAVVL